MSDCGHDPPKNGSKKTRLKFLLLTPSRGENTDEKKTHSLQKTVSQGLLAMHFGSEQVSTTAFCALTVTGTTLSSYAILWTQIPNQYKYWWLWSSRISMPLTTLTKITRTASFLTMKRISSDKRGSAYQVVGLSVAIMTFLIWPCLLTVFVCVIRLL